MGEPTVVCRVCQQLVFIRGREGQRVVKCSNCHEATVSRLLYLYCFFVLQDWVNMSCNICFNTIHWREMLEMGLYQMLVMQIFL